MKSKLLFLAAFVGLVQIGYAANSTTAFPPYGSTPTSSINGTSKAIPDTNLKSRTFYKLSMKRFPKGVVTWTFQGNADLNYLQIDNDPEHLPKYKPGGDFHQDGLWEFVPVRHKGNKTGWYGLRNRGQRGAIMTWSSNDLIDDSRQEQAFHIVMDKAYLGSSKVGEAFLKPVKIQDGSRIYYQLRLKDPASGVVTWHKKEYGTKGSHYIVVDPDQSHLVHYQEGGKWFENTLFIIDSPEVETSEEAKLNDLYDWKAV